MSTVFWPECAEFSLQRPSSGRIGNCLAKEIAKNFQPVRRSNRKKACDSPETNIKLCYLAGDPKEGIFPLNDFREQEKQKAKQAVGNTFFEFFSIFL